MSQNGSHIATKSFHNTQFFASLTTIQVSKMESVRFGMGEKTFSIYFGWFILPQRQWIDEDIRHLFHKVGHRFYVNLFLFSVFYFRKVQSSNTHIYCLVVLCNLRNPRTFCTWQRCSTAAWILSFTAFTIIQRPKVQTGKYQSRGS